MQAILIAPPDSPEPLYIGEAPQPEPDETEVLVKVKAIGVNRADILQRKGLYPPPPGASSIIGLEIAGEVQSVGRKCQHHKPGDAVFGIIPGGAYAEFVVMDEQLALTIPPNLSFEEAAGVAEAFLTAYQALFWLGTMRPRERVLVHAGASGVGTAAIQIAKSMQATVLVTSSAKIKLQRCADLGADVTINYKHDDFAQSVMEATSGHGVDVIVDFIGAAYFESNLKCLAQDGRLVVLALMGGKDIPQFDLSTVLLKRLQIIGSTLRSRDLKYRRRLSQAFGNDFLPKFETKELIPVIDRIFPWDEVNAAHAHMEANRNIGKIILTVT